jgi:Tfp pilus assembly protein PilV
VNCRFHRSSSLVRSHRESGFSLLELLVAIILVDVAVLAIVQTNAAIIRRRNEMRARAAAVSSAGTRLEQLLATPCTPASGTSPRPIAETWTAESVPGGRELRDSVVFEDPGQHVVVLRTRSSC